MIPDVPRLKQVFANPSLDWLVQRLKRRIEHGEPLTGTVSLENATDEQREAVDGLLGRKPSRGKAVQIQLSDLEKILRDAGLCAGLEELVGVLVGPVKDRRAARIENERAWEKLFAEFSGRDGVRPEWLAWIGSYRGQFLELRA